MPKAEHKKPFTGVLPWKKGRFSMLTEASRGRKARMIIALAATLLMVLFNFLSPQIIRITVDNVIDTQPWELPGFLVDRIEAIGGRVFLRQNIWLCGLASASVALVAALTNMLRRYMTLEAAEYMAQGLRNTLYAHIQTLPYDWHVKIQTGDIIQRSTSDVDVIRNFMANHLVEIIRIVVQVSIAAVIMVMMDWQLALWSMLLLPVIFLFSALYFKAVAKRFTKADEAEGALQAAAQENFTGVRVVRAFGREAYEVERFQKKNAEYVGLWTKIGNLLGVYWSFGDVMGGLQNGIVLAMGIIRCASGDMTPGTFIVFTTYVNMMIWPLRQLGRILSELSKTGVSAGRIREILCVDPETDDDTVNEPDLRGPIVFENVTFAYGDDPPVLKNLSFTIKPGETLAILGATGSGKSTLVHLLNRLYDVPEGQGRILVNGTDIRRISRPYLRRHVGLVLQEPFLFSKTIGENIAAPRPEAGAELVRRAAEIAHVHDAIDSFGAKYDTIVGERGVTLSGGQKQRVAIARMLISQPPIMIFDDSLSAVDTETDAHIRASLRKEQENATTIIISHRTSTLMQADKILVLMDGAMEELGSHEELMQREGSYRRIFDLQGSLEEELEQEA